jgi:hypothetical protein
MAERIAVDMKVNGYLQARMNWASYGLSDCLRHGVVYATNALAGFRVHVHFPWTLGHIDIANFQPPALGHLLLHYVP